MCVECTSSSFEVNRENWEWVGLWVNEKNTFHRMRWWCMIYHMPILYGDTMHGSPKCLEIVKEEMRKEKKEDAEMECRGG